MRVRLTLLLAAVATSACTVDHTPDYLGHLRELELESKSGRVETYYSAGAEERAAKLQKIFEEALWYFEERLSVSPPVVLAVLNPMDWEFVSPTGYGAPWASQAAALVVMPANLDQSAIVQEYWLPRERLPRATLRALRNVGLTRETAPYRLNDLIAHHEIGHLILYALDLNQNQVWLDQMLATFVGYAFLRDRYPDIAREWDVLLELDVEALRPDFRSLDKFEWVNDNMTRHTYDWFQGMFHQRVIELYESRGLNVLSDLRSAGITNQKFYRNSAELLAELETILPGFQRWARLVEGRTD